MQVLVTGATGFLGKHITQHLNQQGNIVHRLVRSVNAERDILCDIATSIPDLSGNTFDMIIHCAGKAHVLPKNDHDVHEMYNINLEGTKRLLKGLDSLQKYPQSFVFISSVSVYGRTDGELIDEQQPLLAEDPYGKSKILAEEVLQQWGIEKNVAVTILRLPLLVGKNPPGNLGSMINAIKNNKYLRIGTGKARKSMVMAEDVAGIIPALTGKKGIYNLTDRYHPDFATLENYIAQKLGKGKIKQIPHFAAALLAKVGDVVGNKFPLNTTRLKKITSTLTFNDEKAVKELGWAPHRIFEKFEVI